MCFNHNTNDFFSLDSCLRSFCIQLLKRSPRCLKLMVPYQDDAVPACGCPGRCTATGCRLRPGNAVSLANSNQLNGLTEHSAGDNPCLAVGYFLLVTVATFLWRFRKSISGRCCSPQMVRQIFHALHNLSHYTRALPLP